MNPQYRYKKRKKLSTEFKNHTGHGSYFVTMVSHSRKYVLSQIEDGTVILTSAGQIVEFYWLKIPSKFNNVKLGEFVLMPDHFHGILEIYPKPGSDLVSLARIIHWFKTWTTNDYHKEGDGSGKYNLGRLWQRGYNESRIPKGSAYSQIEKYIKKNPKGHRMNREKSAGVKPGRTRKS